MGELSTLQDEGIFILESLRNQESRGGTNKVKGVRKRLQGAGLDHDAFHAVVPASGP